MTDEDGRSKPADTDVNAARIRMASPLKSSLDDPSARGQIRHTSHFDDGKQTFRRNDIKISVAANRLALNIGKDEKNLVYVELQREQTQQSPSEQQKPKKPTSISSS